MRVSKCRCALASPYRTAAWTFGSLQMKYSGGVFGCFLTFWSQNEFVFLSRYFPEGRLQPSEVGLGPRMYIHFLQLGFGHDFCSHCLPSVVFPALNFSSSLHSHFILNPFGFIPFAFYLGYAYYLLPTPYSVLFLDKILVVRALPTYLSQTAEVLFEHKAVVKCLMCWFSVRREMTEGNSGRGAGNGLLHSIVCVLASMQDMIHPSKARSTLALTRTSLCT